MPAKAQILFKYKEGSPVQNLSYTLQSSESERGNLLPPHITSIHVLGQSIRIVFTNDIRLGLSLSRNPDEVPTVITGDNLQITLVRNDECITYLTDQGHQPEYRIPFPKEVRITYIDRPEES
jgi:hypothetical protein